MKKNMKKILLCLVIDVICAYVKNGIFNVIKSCVDMCIIKKYPNLGRTIIYFIEYIDLCYSVRELYQTIAVFIEFLTFIMQ